MNVALFEILAAVLLLPLIPALAIYWLLPSRTSVAGPFKGLQVKLQGAFAGYFILVLLASGLAMDLKPDESKFPHYEPFKLYGSVDLGALPNGADQRLLRVTAYPSIQDAAVDGDGIQWTVDLPIGTQSDGSHVYPYEGLILQYQGFKPEKIDLSSGRIDDGANKTITFGPITLTRQLPTTNLVSVTATPQ